MKSRPTLFTLLLPFLWSFTDTNTLITCQAYIITLSLPVCLWSKCTHFTQLLLLHLFVLFDLSLDFHLFLKMSVIQPLPLRHFIRCCCLAIWWFICPRNIWLEWWNFLLSSTYALRVVAVGGTVKLLFCKVSCPCIQALILAKLPFIWGWCELLAILVNVRSVIIPWFCLTF